MNASVLDLIYSLDTSIDNKNFQKDLDKCLEAIIDYPHDSGKHLHELVLQCRGTPTLSDLGDRIKYLKSFKKILSIPDKWDIKLHEKYRLETGKVAQRIYKGNDTLATHYLNWFEDNYKPKINKKENDQTKPSLIDSIEDKEWISKFNQLGIKKKIKLINEVFDFFLKNEHQNRLLLFFLMLSNYRKDYREFVFIRADSSSGKNELVKCVLHLFSNRDYMQYTSNTASTFNYEDLSGLLFIYLKEMVNNDEGIMNVIKQMYDKDRIHKETIKEDGRMKVLTHILESVGMISTLSFETLTIDVINRSWILVSDMSTKQTQAIMERKRLKRKSIIMFDIGKEKMLKYAKLISESYKYLKWDYEVMIPYVDVLKPIFPKKTPLNLRRDDDKLYNLIETITIFNQHDGKHRKISFENKEYIYANYEDLKMALDIAKDHYIQQILHIDTLKIEIIQAFDKQDSYTISNIYELLREKVGSRDTIQRKLFDLRDDGYLDATKDKRVWQFTRIKKIDLMTNFKLNEAKVNEMIEESFNRYASKSKHELESEISFSMFDI